MVTIDPAKAGGSGYIAVVTVKGANGFELSSEASVANVCMQSPANAGCDGYASKRVFGPLPEASWATTVEG